MFSISLDSFVKLVIRFGLCKHFQHYFHFIFTFYANLYSF